MPVKIFYFTGSGNSLKIAKDISKEIDSVLIPMPQAVESGRIDMQGDAFGIIFPVYHATSGESGMPFIVKKFLDKLPGLQSKYIFAVCTHLGAPRSTLGNLSEIIRSKGGGLSFGIAVKAGIPYTFFEKIKYLVTHKAIRMNDKFARKIKKLEGKNKKKTGVIIGAINNSMKLKPETPSKIIEALYRPINQLSKAMAIMYYKNLSKIKTGSFEELVNNSDRSFVVNENCRLCGTCVKICPANNIIIRENKLLWNHKCENCFACYQWCPNNAVEGEIVAFQRKYHHPDITIGDMLKK